MKGRESDVDRASRTPSAAHLAAVASVAVLAQLAVLSYKGTLIFEWRPVDLNSIALNYYRHGFDFLRPQILWGGAGPGYVETECPILPFGIALLYAVLGVHDRVALILPLLVGIALPLALYLLTARVFTRADGFVAALFAATIPTWLDMTTGVWPDPPPIVCVTIALYALVRWVEGDGAPWFVGAAIAVGVAALFKLTALYVGLPVAYLLWVKYGRSWWRMPGTWLFGVMVLILPVLWYAHAYRLFLEYHNTFGILASGYLKFATSAILTDPRFYVRTFLRFALFHATLAGLPLIIIGASVRPQRRVQLVFVVWLAAVIVYLLVAAAGVDLGHFQYMLPIVPPCAALAGVGTMRLFRAIGSNRSGASGSAVPVAVAAAALLVMNAAGANYVYQTRGTGFRERSREKMATGRALAKLSMPEELVLVVDADMNGVTPEHSMTPPEVFYFSDRRGWYQAMAWLTPEKIERLRGDGARYLAVSAQDAGRFRSEYVDLYRSCLARYAALVDGGDGIVYRLTAPMAAPGTQ